MHESTTVSPSAQSAVDSFHRSVVITPEHDRIHDGRMFQAIVEVTLGIAAEHFCHIRTGANEIHMYWDIDASGAGEVFMTENPTLTGNGTADVPIRNKNLGLDETELSSVFYTILAGSITLEGDEFDAYVLGPDKRAGGLTRSEHEWILPPNSSFLVKLVSGVASNLIKARLQFYEVVI